MYKLIGVDFDGTLLNDEKIVTEDNIKYLKLAKDSNIKVVAVTGRTLENVKYVVDINIFDYLVLNNGANIFNVSNNKLIYDNSINRALVKEITEFTDIYSRQFNYCTYKDYEIYKNFIDKKIPFVREIRGIEEATENIAKINIYLYKESDIYTLYNLIKEKYPKVKTIIMQDSNSDEKWITITKNNIDKKAGLQQLGKHLNIPLSEMVFFGDGLNDLEAMESVGMGVAMGNALEEVIKRSDDITLSNNDSGVANYIKNKILQK